MLGPTLVTPRTVACQAPLFMGLPGQEYWSGLPFPSAGSSVQFSRSVVSDSLRPMNHNTPGLPVHHQLLESTQTHVHQVGDAIQPSHPLSSPSPPSLNLSQHQRLFFTSGAKVLEFQLEH